MDLDVYLFYALPGDKRRNDVFPLQRGTAQYDFSDGDRGRQLHIDEERNDLKLMNRVRRWEAFAGRRVDLLARAIPAEADTRVAVRRWFEEGLTRFGSERQAPFADSRRLPDPRPCGSVVGRAARRAPATRELPRVRCSRVSCVSPWYEELRERYRPDRGVCRPGPTWGTELRTSP